MIFSWEQNFVVPFFAFFLFAFIIILIFLSYVFSPKNVYLNKVKPYECGFDAFMDSPNNSADIHFYLILLSFLLFDVEVILIMPWVVCAGLISSTSIFIMLKFLFVILLAYVFEYSFGVFKWSSFVQLNSFLSEYKKN